MAIFYFTDLSDDARRYEEMDTAPAAVARNDLAGDLGNDKAILLQSGHEF